MSFHDTAANLSPPQSIATALDLVMQQVEYQCFVDIHTRRTDRFYMELCLIISEVFVMNSKGVIRINAVETPVGLVQEVFARLRHEHVRLVFDNFQEVTCRVYNKRAYLRTALYNAVFEVESNYINGAYY